MLSLLGGLALGFAASPTCPSNAEEIRQGTGCGFGAALLVGLGAVAGDAAVLVLVLLGAASLLPSLPALQGLLWLVGAAVLLHVASSSLREARQAAPAAGLPGMAGGLGFRPARAFWTGFALTAFNPYTALWWVGLLAPASRSGVPVAFSLAVLCGALLWFLALAWLLRLGGDWLRRAVRRWLLAGSGLAVGALGAWFLWQGALSLATWAAS